MFFKTGWYTNGGRVKKLFEVYFFIRPEGVDTIARGAAPRETNVSHKSCLTTKISAPKSRSV